MTKRSRILRMTLSIFRRLFGAQEPIEHTPEDIENMKLSRTMLIDDAGDAKWLLKDVQDSAHENFKRRLAEDIHRFSQTLISQTRALQERKRSGFEV